MKKRLRRPSKKDRNPSVPNPRATDIEVSLGTPVLHLTLRHHQPSIGSDCCSYHCTLHHPIVPSSSPRRCWARPNSGDFCVQSERASFETTCYASTLGGWHAPCACLALFFFCCWLSTTAHLPSAAYWPHSTHATLLPTPSTTHSLSHQPASRVTC